MAIELLEAYEDDENEDLGLEEDDENGDWIKTLNWDLPTTLDEFMDALQITRDATGRKKLRHSLTLPAAKAMPAELRQEIEEFIRGDAE